MTELPDLFPGYAARTFQTEGAEIFARVGGSGPPLLLLHGYPETHVMWHRIAPALAKRFTLVLPDLRGYGASSAPPDDDGHRAYSKRTMAADMMAVMTALGHQRFAVIGHDRGGRVAYRLALDHGAAVERLVVLDIVTTYDIWHNFTHRLAMRMFHWPLLAQPAPVPEDLIAADAVRWLEDRFRRGTMARSLDAIDAGALAHYRAFFTAPGRIAATCADYRAGAGIDLADDEADRAAGRKIACPTRAVWGETGNPSHMEDPLGLWRAWCDRVDGGTVPCGHFMAEEAPEATLDMVLPFLSGS
ncbi:MAG: alpha/beta hydrolase [Hyphomicrobiales bacterium]|nr:alpha/beta hydrolase [Hyphomicrobiales bacterium]